MVASEETVRPFPAAGILVALVGAMTLAAGAALAVDAWLSAGRIVQAEAFQQLVGGQGFGTALDLSVCPFAFDPRVEGSCQFEDGPIPGGKAFCPCHAASVFFYRPLPGSALGPQKERHVDLP
jgi:hypothetical protein